MNDRTRLLRSIWTGLPTDVDVDPAALRAFKVWFQPRLARDAQVILVVLTVFNLVFWATDTTVFSAVPGAADALSHGRAILVGVAVLSFLGVSWAPSRTTTTVTAAGAAMCFTAADTFARIGGPSTAWFHFIYPFALVPICWYMSPPRRVLVTAVYGFAVYEGYFGFHPPYLQDPMAVSTLAHFGYIQLLSVVVGVYIDRARLRSWALGRALEEERHRLSARVAEQTHDLRRLAQRLDEVQEDERKRLARELHDEFGQTLGALRLALRMASSRFERDPVGLGPHLAQIRALLDDLTDQTRRVLQTLRPVVLENLGLQAAVEWLAGQLERHGGPACSVEVPVSVELPLPIANVAYRCVQEALTNVARHAAARSAHVRVTLAGGELVAEVEDDGVGLSNRPTQGLGLVGMRERVAAVGGRLVIDTGVRQGTRVRVFLPLKEAA